MVNNFCDPQKKILHDRSKQVATSAELQNFLLQISKKIHPLFMFKVTFCTFSHVYTLEKKYFFLKHRLTFI